MHFDTFGDLVHFADTRENKSPFAEEKSRCLDSNNFRATANWQECMTLATQGWADGAEKAKALNAQLVDKITSIIERDQLFYDVQGLDFDLGLLLSGEPEHYLNVQQVYSEGQGHRVIKLALNITASGGIQSDILIAKGAAVSALVYALELCGNRVEVTVGGCVNRGQGEMTATVKRAEDALELEQLVFALAHPSTLRRLMLSVWESDAAHMSNVGATYGSPSELNNPERFDVYIAGSKYGDPQWSNTDETIAWIKAQLKLQNVVLTD
jgi:hypothetical protein